MSVWLLLTLLGLVWLAAQAVDVDGDQGATDAEVRRAVRRVEAGEVERPTDAYDLGQRSEAEVEALRERYVERGEQP